jgi:ribonuclease VapC
MIFADASALVAIIAGEPDALALADCLQAEQERRYSAISAWETAAALCRSYTFSVAMARARVRLFLDTLDFKSIDIGAPEYELALEAYAQFGKGRHPAALNLGDCFAYACAKANQAKLLFKGDDFTKTDIPAAMAA